MVNVYFFVCFNKLELVKAANYSRKGELFFFFDSRRFMSLLTYYAFQRIYIKITLGYELNVSDSHHDSTDL